MSSLRPGNFHYLFALLLLSVLHLCGQEAPPSPSGQASTPDSAVIRSTTLLVEVNVVVQDKHGQPITGLHKSDFTLTDQGAVQEISYVTDPSAGRAAVSRATHPAIPANVYSNRFDQTDRMPQTVTIIFLDLLNTDYEDQVHARTQALNFLKTIQPQDHVAVYALTSKLFVLQDFTFDNTALVRALNNLNGYNSQRLDASTPTQITLPDSGHNPQAKQLEDFLNSGMGKIKDSADESRALLTANAMQGIANHVSRIPGRKNLIWISGSFPISVGYTGYQIAPVDRLRADFSQPLERAARAMNQANITIYPVDARGLMTNVDITTPSTTSFDKVHLPTQNTPDEINFDSMVFLANLTGGKAFHNTNDFSPALKQALSDSDSSYVIGFYPNHEKWDDKFHELKVKVNAPGANIRYRKGYYAYSKPSSNEETGHAALQSVLFTPMESTGLDVAVEVDPASGAKRKFVIGLDARQLALAHEGKNYRGKLILWLVQLGPNDVILGSEPRILDLSYTAEQFAVIQHTGITLTRHLPVAASSVMVRILVQDMASGAIGSASVPFHDGQLVENSATNTPPPIPPGR